MRDRWIAYTPILLLAGLAGLTYWLDQKVQPSGPIRDGSQRHDPDFVVDNFTATRMTVDGNPRYSISAKRMLHYPDDTDTELELPQLTHYSETEAPATIRANKGLVSGNGEDAYFIGDVLLHRAAFADQEEMSMATSYLHVIPDEDLAKTDKEVTLTRGNSTLKAVGLEFNNETRELKLLSHVRGKFETPKKGKLLPWDKRR